MLNQLQRPVVHPYAFRLTSITRLPGKNGKGVSNTATIFHEECSLEVTWQSTHVDVRLKRGCYVAIRGLGATHHQGGAYPIQRLDLLDKPLATLNPFETISMNWVRDRSWITRASALWAQLSRPFQHLLSAVWWDGGRFERFVCGPAALFSYRPVPNANLRHAVETAEHAISLAHGLPEVSHSVLIAAALLHDAGKADDFRLAPEQGGYTYSQRGNLVGHRYTVLEWLAVARGKVGVVIPDAQYLALIHALIAGQGMTGPGVREVQTIEASLLAVAGRIWTNEDCGLQGYVSGDANLYYASKSNCR